MKKCKSINNLILILYLQPASLLKARLQHMFCCIFYKFVQSRNLLKWDSSADAFLLVSRNISAYNFFIPRLWHMFFCESCKIFRNNHFAENLQRAASNNDYCSEIILQDLLFIKMENENISKIIVSWKSLWIFLIKTMIILHA